MLNFNLILNDLKKKLELIRYNILLFKLHIKDPDPGTMWYSTVYSNWFFKLKLWILCIGVILIFFVFAIYRFIKEHESLVLFIYIIWFFLSLFYIFYIKV